MLFFSWIRDQYGRLKMPLGHHLQVRGASDGLKHHRFFSPTRYRQALLMNLSDQVGGNYRAQACSAA